MKKESKAPKKMINFVGALAYLHRSRRGESSTEDKSKKMQYWSGPPIGPIKLWLPNWESDDVDDGEVAGRQAIRMMNDDGCDRIVVEYYLCERDDVLSSTVSRHAREPVLYDVIIRYW